MLIKRKYRKYGSAREYRKLTIELSPDTIVLIEQFSWNQQGQQESYGATIDKMAQIIARMLEERST